MLVGVVGFANTADNTVTEKNQLKCQQISEIVKDSNYTVVSCTSSTVTTTTTYRDGRQTVNTTTTVTCDTPAELAQYNKLMGR